MAPKIFVSHSHKDGAFCRTIVTGLQNAGADVWYDEDDMIAGELTPAIEAELQRCALFVVILSPNALTSQWVEQESRWAFTLYRKDPTRDIVPVTAAAIHEDDIWLFLRDFKRVEADGARPYSRQQATERLLHILGLIPDGDQLIDSGGLTPDELVKQGRESSATGNWQEALTYFASATHRYPQHTEAWSQQARALLALKRNQDALVAIDRALALEASNARFWALKGWALNRLGRKVEALDALNRSLGLAPNDAETLRNKAYALVAQKQHSEEQYSEALANIEQALAHNPRDIWSWRVKVHCLTRLRRYTEALPLLDQILMVSPFDVWAWHTQGASLGQLDRHSEALKALEYALQVDNLDASIWRAKGYSLSQLGQHSEAVAAYRKAVSLDRESTGERDTAA